MGIPPPPPVQGCVSITTTLDLDRSKNVWCLCGPCLPAMKISPPPWTTGGAFDVPRFPGMFREFKMSRDTPSRERLVHIYPDP